MHDPMVVAHEIRRPWPQRSRWADAKPGQPRWKIRLRHKCVEGCDHPPFKRDPFPWWKPSSYASHWTLAGRGFYWPSLVTIWHVEPGGHDSGEVCKHYRREQLPDGTWTSTTMRGWRWHVFHVNWRTIALHVPFTKRTLACAPIGADK